MKDAHFSSIFEKLTGHSPFPWQVRLFKAWSEGSFDQTATCTLPTGAGKTLVIAIWLIALALHPNRVPRRLVYVVNRRTVVDQTSDEVRNIAKNLVAAGLHDALKALCTIEIPEGEIPLAISTLRGQMADNRTWSADPTRPAVVVGTVDLIGSRLLFGGYRIGFKSRPLHAGFLGQDVLVVHDEAHLEYPFQSLLEGIRDRQRLDHARHESADQRAFRIVELTATSRTTEKTPSFSLNQDDWNHPVLLQRLDATKQLRLHPFDDDQQLPDRLAEKALEHLDSGATILIYARQVEHVEKIAARLLKEDSSLKSGRVLTLTGTMRGLERDELVQTEAFRRFLPHHKGNGQNTVFLVCTSAGEVGVNLSAKHLVCDLTPFESMAQRLGRVNRFGDSESASSSRPTVVDVLYPAVIPPGKKDDEKLYNSALKKTLRLLKMLKGDASPRALDSLPAQQKREAFGPPPQTVPVSEILFDNWSMTTVRRSLAGRPPLAPYLHGLSTFDPPQTSVAWRTEVELIHGDLLLRYPPEALLEAFPLKPHELLADRTDRVFKRLQSLHSRISKADPDKRISAWVIDESGDAATRSLKAIVADPQRSADELKRRLENRTVLLPPSVGGLTVTGHLSGGKDRIEGDEGLDVSERWLDANGEPRRQRIHGSVVKEMTGWRLVISLDLSKPPEANDDEENTEDKVWRWYERQWGGDGEGVSASSHQAEHLDSHLKNVATFAREFAKSLKLEPDEATALEIAGRFHDLGKARQLWQRSIGNTDSTAWLAKSGPGMNPIRMGTYRHEFGSLINAEEQPDFKQLPEPIRDLVLHLVTAHHGRGRPHIPENEIYDPDYSLTLARKAAAKVPHRFERLQRRYGRWGLAYLESLLRAADHAVSAGRNLQQPDLKT